MAVEFRQRTASEFLQMLNRRKWHLLLPTLAFGIAVAFVVSKLPSFYESKTTLTLKPAAISSEVVKPLTEDDLSQRLQSMNQEILSRSTLEPMIVKYNLFEQERAAGQDMGLIVDKMRKNINVEAEKAEDNRVTGFTLRYIDRTPEAARIVASDLAGKYVNAQIKGTIESAEGTKEFIEKQVAETKAALDAVEQRRLQIMTQNSDTLPDFQQGVIAQLEGLRRREETISKEKDTLIVDKARWNQSIQSINSQIGIAETFGAKDAEDIVKNSRIEDTPAYGQLIQKRADLTAKLANLKKQYTPKHPEVIETQTQIDKVNDEINDLTKNSRQRAENAAASGNRKTDLQKKNLEIERQKAQEQINLIDRQIAGKDEEMRQNTMQISMVESKMATMPGVKIALEAIDNQYKSAKTAYDEMLKMKNDAQLQVERETNSKGETIRVVDAANLPVAPVNASKKPVFILAGAGLGFALGLLLAAMFEIPRLFKIQNIEDAKYYTGLPVLASVPPLLTKQELSWKKRSHLLRVAAGIIAAFGSIPVIIIFLQKTRILEQLSS